MRFSVDAHAIGQRLTGNEVYVRNLLNGFAALDQSSEFIAYLASNANGASACVPRRFVTREVSANSFMRLGLDLSRKLREDRPDLLHVQYTSPWNCPVPVVVSVHDVSFLEHPEFFPWPRAMQLRITVKRTVNLAARVITPSEFSRQRVMRAYGLDEAKIAAVPIAVSPSFRRLNRDAVRSKRKLGFDAPFVLSVGDLQPRKNQIALIRAFKDLMQETGLPHHLVFVGKQTWFAGNVMEAAKKSGMSERIHFTGFVADEELLHFYNAADMMVFPSLYEGFGLPVLEAMACGCAVACSNAAAMPEVADSAALLFDPASVPQMAACMRDLLLNPELRTRMERLGQQRASLFTWERTASRTLEIYHEVAGVEAGVSSQSVPVSQR